MQVNFPGGNNLNFQRVNRILDSAPFDEVFGDGKKAHGKKTEKSDGKKAGNTMEKIYFIHEWDEHDAMKEAIKRFERDLPGADIIDVEVELKSRGLTGGYYKVTIKWKY